MREFIARSRIFNSLTTSYASLIQPPAGWLSALGGLRTIAVLLVLNHHFGAAFASAYGENRYTRFGLVRDGWIGVDLFFVLSGFLIGRQLWKELDRTRNVSIRRFVFRRGLRIWPLYYAVYIGLVAFNFATGTRHGNMWPDPVFLADYFRTALVPGGWSLCIEEQFYLLAPVLLMSIAGLRGQAQRALLWVLFIAEPVLRALEWVHYTGTVKNSQNAEAFATLYFNFHTHCDGLIIGLIISSMWRRVRIQQGFFNSNGVILIMTNVAAVALAVADKAVFGFTSLALIFGSIVWFCVSPSAVGLFRSKIFFWISQLSFGIYMNHQIVLSVVVSKILPHLAYPSQGSTAQMLVALGITIFLSSLFALVTYCLIEQPALQLRGALEHRTAK